ERLDNAGFHVKSAGAVGLVAGKAKGHFGDGAGGVDRIVVAEDEELRSGRRNGGRPNDAKMIAAMLLAEHLDERASQQPFVGQKTTAAVGSFFIQAGRFQERELLEDLQHVRQPAAEQGKKSLRKWTGRHEGVMVTTSATQGNTGEREEKVGKAASRR